MTFKQFLLEDGNPLSIEEAVELFKRDYSNNDVKYPLYRASPTDVDAISEETSRSREKSLGRSLPFQQFMFSNGRWDEYPSRQQSTFAATEPNGPIFDKVDRITYAIYPKNGVKIAVWPDYDFNLSTFGYTDFAVRPGRHRASFAELRSDLEPYTDLDGPLATLGSQIKKVVQNIISDEPFDKLRKSILIAKSEAENLQDTEDFEFDDDIEDIVKSFSSQFVDFVISSNKITPASIGAKLIDNSQIKTLKGKTHEVWFSGKYLRVPIHLIGEFKRAIGD